jgi:serine phosphatase RsbU (regulator of sigma subunit)
MGVARERRLGSAQSVLSNTAVHTLPSRLASFPNGLLTPWDDAGFEVSAECWGVCGRTGGGDFFTLAVRAPGHIGVTIGDACGRGADGEAQLARVLPEVRRLAVSGASPAELLTELNRTVAEQLPLDRFVTAAAFEFNMRAGVLTVANAAHVPAIIRRGWGRHVSVVGRPSGMPLGIDERTIYLDEHHELNVGDVIVLMTDGVLEAVESDLLSMTTLKRLLGEAEEGAADVHKFLLRKCEECTRGNRVDDMTLMALAAISEPMPASGGLRDLAQAS